MTDKGSTNPEHDEFRQSVIRKALLLGFECEEYERSHLGVNSNQNGVDRYIVRTKPAFRFTFDGTVRDAYGDIYSAAWDYLRLCGLPREVTGDFLG